MVTQMLPGQVHVLRKQGTCKWTQSKRPGLPPVGFSLIKSLCLKSDNFVAALSTTQTLRDERQGFPSQRLPASFSQPKKVDVHLTENWWKIITPTLFGMAKSPDLNFSICWDATVLIES